MDKIFSSYYLTEKQTYQTSGGMAVGAQGGQGGAWPSDY